MVHTHEPLESRPDVEVVTESRWRMPGYFGLATVICAAALGALALIADPAGAPIGLTPVYPPGQITLPVAVGR